VHIGQAPDAAFSDPGRLDMPVPMMTMMKSSCSNSQGKILDNRRAASSPLFFQKKRPFSFRAVEDIPLFLKCRLASNVRSVCLASFESAPIALNRAMRAFCWFTMRRALARCRSARLRAPSSAGHSQTLRRLAVSQPTLPGYFQLGKYCALCRIPLCPRRS
jgi:hypothetical protein